MSQPQSKEEVEEEGEEKKKGGGSRMRRKKGGVGGRRGRRAGGGGGQDEEEEEEKRKHFRFCTQTCVSFFAPGRWNVTAAPFMAAPVASGEGWMSAPWPPAFNTFICILVSSPSASVIRPRRKSSLKVNSCCWKFTKSSFIFKTLRETFWTFFSLSELHFFSESVQFCFVICFLTHRSVALIL